MKKGNDLIISANGKALAASKSCSLDLSADTTEVALAGSGQFKNYIAGRRSWSITTNHLVGDETQVKDMFSNVGQVFNLTWQMRGEGSSDSMTGKALCTQCKITATRGNLLQGSFTWKGTGPIE